MRVLTGGRLSPEARRVRWIGGGALGLFLLAVALRNPFTTAPLLPQWLHISYWTGVACPFCGGTRSAWLALHGRWQEAWMMNPLGVMAVLALGLWALAWLMEAGAGRQWLRQPRFGAGWWAVGAAVPGLYVAAWWLKEIAL